MKKKGQAAMEFLMTYGWAMLIVLVVIGALAYFGVLSPSMLLPEKCIVATGLNCVDHIASDGGIAIKLQNSAGRGMIVREVIFSSDALAGNCSTGPIVGLLKPSETKNFVAADPTACGFVGAGRDKQKYEISVEFSWLDSEGLTHTKNGELLSRVESGVDVSGLVGGGGGSEGYVGYGSSIAGYWKFDEGSGTQTADSSSNGNDGTLTNFACTTLDCNSSSGWVSNGKRGKALRFDGVNDYVALGNSVLLDPPDAGTYEFWMFPNSTAGQQVPLAGRPSWDNPPNAKGYFFRVLNGALTFYIADNTGTLRITPAVTVTTGTWRHVAAVWNGTIIRLYVNGVPTAGVSSVGHTQGTAGSLIGSYGVNYYRFNGTLDEVRIYNRALTQEEISALYAAG